MKLYHAFALGKHKLDRIDFFLAERRPKDQLRQILYHFGLNNIRAMIKSDQLSFKEAEHLCIIASKLLTLSEVEGLKQYVTKIMGIAERNFIFREIKPPLVKSALQDAALRLAINEYHEDGLFMALWCNPYYHLPVKIGGFVAKEAQFILEKQATQIDKQFTEFVQSAETVDDLLEKRDK
jgi:hypothetical protein